MEGSPYKIAQTSKYKFKFTSIGKINLLKYVSFNELEDVVNNVALGTVVHSGYVNFAIQLTTEM